MVKEKQVYYFTFGMGQKYAGKCQPILASNYDSARETMNELYGAWAFQYTRKEYMELRQKGTANEVILDPVEGR